MPSNDTPTPQSARTIEIELPQTPHSFSKLKPKSHISKLNQIPHHVDGSVGLPSIRFSKGELGGACLCEFEHSFIERAVKLKSASEEEPE